MLTKQGKGLFRKYLKKIALKSSTKFMDVMEDHLNITIYRIVLL